MLEKTFTPHQIEKKYTKLWEDSGVCACDPASDAEPYTIMIPPPNVTGSLHIGHALTFTLQDILIRFQRGQGKDVLWQPGTDHAGIATQMVVERNLAEEGISRRDLGREKFVEKVWAWKEESGGTIIKQLRHLGASLNWERERFTMDEGLSNAVRKVFIQLYKEGLIYRDKRLVNWDPKLETAISDLEVVTKEVQGKMWHFKYPLEDDPTKFISIATTRPETMLGDGAVAVHPSDERYKNLVGKNCILPIVGRALPIIADEHPDPEVGSGAVKITAAHDFNDFEVGRRHDVPLINLFDINACMNENAPEQYRGLDRYAARELVIKELDALNLIEKIEDHTIQMPYGDRSDVVIEPYLTDQWYVNAEVLAQPALEAVRNGTSKFVPKNWEKTYYQWLENIQPWCISRQLWWGHRIPAWYGPDHEVFVAESEEEAHAQAAAHYGKVVDLKQDEDVLDTWFSSALWPFSTLGWPEETPELKKYYPTSVLVTGFDIIFFWVARMMMFGLHFMKEVPFHDIYIHALVRDETGQKMSKSKGNVVDPLDLIGEYGADAVRFTLAIMASQGQDINLNTQRVAGYRNFATKLWNAARFTQMNGCKVDPDFDPLAVQMPVNRWIVDAMAQAFTQVEAGINAYKFNEAAENAYQFVWGTFCDWYLEFTKPLLNGEDAAVKAETHACTSWVLDQILLMLHPFMPFITEELWQQLADREGLLAGEQWPAFYKDHNSNNEIQAEMDWTITLISTIRTIRAEMNVPGGAKIPALLKDLTPAQATYLSQQKELVLTLARLQSLEIITDIPEGSAQAVVAGSTLILPLAEVIDLGQEKDRLANEINKLNNEIDQIDKKLGNPQFCAKAPAEVVAEQQNRKDKALAAKEKLSHALNMLRVG